MSKWQYEQHGETNTTDKSETPTTKTKRRSLLYGRATRRGPSLVFRDYWGTRGPVDQHPLTSSLKNLSYCNFENLWKIVYLLYDIKYFKLSKDEKTCLFS